MTFPENFIFPGFPDPVGTLMSPIDNNTALVQVMMAWCRTGDKPLPGPMMTQHICDTRLRSGSTLVQVMVCYLITPSHGPLTRYAKLQVAHAPGMPGTFPPAADFKGNR